MAKFAVILAAAGKSERFQDPHYKKPFAILDGKAVWLHSVERFLTRDDVKQLVLVIAPEDREDFQAKFGANIVFHGIDLVDGGAERTDSVQHALEVVRDEIDYVAVHDAARPCLADEWIDRVFKAARQSGAAILASRITGTLKRSADGKQVAETVARDNLWEAQTPQVFQRQLLIEAYAKRGSLRPTDEAQAVEALGQPVTLVDVPRMNFKITTRDDLRWAQYTLKALPKPKLRGSVNPFADDDMWR